MAIELKTDNFTEEVMDSKLPVLVDFWAPWCGPCKAVAPHLEQLADECSGKMKVCKLNVDDAPQVATQYAVMSIPTLMIFAKGKVAEKRVGVMNKEDLEKFIQPYL